MTALYNTNNMSLALMDVDNHLVGRPRIRQVRVLPVDCYMPSQLKPILKQCYPNFSPSLESTAALLPEGQHTTVMSKPA